MVCLALELVGPWVMLGFNVGMEAFDELLSINVAWSQEFSDVLKIWDHFHYHCSEFFFLNSEYFIR